MKKVFVILSFFIGNMLSAQSHMFLRVFNETGKKIHKGYLRAITDSTLTISLRHTTYEIPVHRISTVKLRRSFGHTVIMTSLISAGSFAILGAASADPNAWIFAYTAGEGALTGFLFGAAAGVLPGSILAGARQRKQFKIYQSRENWKKAKPALLSYLTGSQ